MPKKKLLKRIPKLPPDKLEQAIAALAVTRLSKNGRLQLERMLRAAANGDAESIDVVIATLDPIRKGNVTKTVSRLAGLRRGLLQRGTMALNALEEFDELVEEANRVTRDSNITQGMGGDRQNE